MTASRVDVAALEAALAVVTVPLPWTDIPTDAEDGFVWEVDDVALVASINAAPAFVALVRAVEALADELSSQVKPRSFHPAGTHSDGRSSAYADAATRLRSAVGAALNPQETGR